MLSNNPLAVEAKKRPEQKSGKLFRMVKPVAYAAMTLLSACASTPELSRQNALLVDPSVKEEYFPVEVTPFCIKMESQKCVTHKKALSVLDVANRVGEGELYAQILKEVNGTNEFVQFVLLPFTKKMQNGVHGKKIREAQITRRVVENADDAVLAAITGGLSMPIKSVIGAAVNGAKGDESVFEYLEQLNGGDHIVAHKGLLSKVERLIADGRIKAGEILTVLLPKKAPTELASKEE